MPAFFVIVFLVYLYHDLYPTVALVALVGFGLEHRCLSFLRYVATQDWDLEGGFLSMFSIDIYKMRRGQFSAPLNQIQLCKCCRHCDLGRSPCVGLYSSLPEIGLPSSSSDSHRGAIYNIMIWYMMYIMIVWRYYFFKPEFDINFGVWLFFLVQ